MPHETLNWRSWTWQYIVPVVIQLAALIIMATTVEGLTGIFLWPYVVAPLLALLIGMLFRPKYVIIIPLVLVVLLGLNDVGSKPVMWGVMWGVVVLVPHTILIWVGKMLRGVIDKFRHKRRATRSATLTLGKDQDRQQPGQQTTSGTA